MVVVFSLAINFYGVSLLLEFTFSEEKKETRHCILRNIVVSGLGHKACKD